MSLEFATTDELIHELLHRTTFIGVVVHSRTEHRSSDTKHGDFQVCTNLADQDLLRLLEETAELIKNGNYRRVVR